MSTEFLAAKAHPSYAVAVTIANACPEALFCGFKTKPKADGTHAKIPVSKTGAGVGADIDQAMLVNCAELAQMIEPPQNCEYWGIFMQSRMTFDPFNDLVLTILDLDTKRSTAPRDIRMVKLMDLAKENGLLTERSHSKKGGHIIFLAKPDQTLPPKIDLGNHQEVEIFGHPGSAGKNVMLTGDSMRGDIKEIGCTVKEFLAKAGIQLQEPKPEPKHPATQFDFAQMPSRVIQSDFGRALEALNCISPDIDYPDWIAIGQALHSEFGEQGKNAWYSWSASGSKYQGEKDLDSHWRSFGKKDGVSMGTLYKHAKDHGWQPPTKQTERKSAVEDFAAVISQTKSDAPAATETPDPSWPELSIDLTHLKAIDYLIEGFMAHSFFILAGQPGVGKTTAILSMCMVMAGFTIDGCEIHAKNKRKSIIVTEDSDQVIRTLFAYSKHYRIDNLNDWFVVIDARRSNVKDLLRLAHNIERHTVNGIRPLLVLDTANATMDIDNENDNSEVGSFIAAIKQTIYVQQKAPVCILTHTNKTISRQDSDAMARGASAFTGDATLTGVLFMDEDNQRYLKLTKTRYEPAFREIKFNSVTFPELVTTPNGDMQEIICRVAIPAMSSEQDRMAAKQSMQDSAREQRIQDKCDEVCMHVQSIINDKGNVIMRRGPGRPNIPKELQGHYQLDWTEIFSSVKGSDAGYIRKHIGTAIFARFAPNEPLSGWVRLT